MHLPSTSTGTGEPWCKPRFRRHKGSRDVVRLFVAMVEVLDPPASSLPWSRCWIVNQSGEGREGRDAEVLPCWDAGVGVAAGYEMGKWVLGFHSCLYTANGGPIG
jgi:hypothetical protein